jgi:hypothetical protein
VKLLASRFGIDVPSSKQRCFWIGDDVSLKFLRCQQQLVSTNELGLVFKRFLRIRVRDKRRYGSQTVVPTATICGITDCA